MAGTPMSSMDARKMVRGVQIGAVALGVSAAALWALDVPGLKAEPIAKPSMDSPGAGVDAGSGGATGRPPSSRLPEPALEVATRLELARERAPAPPPAPPQIERPTEQPVAQNQSNWKFLGTMRAGGRTLAVVSIDGEQSILAEGRVLGEVEVVSISPAALTLREGGAERTLERAPREGSSVTWARMASNAPPASAGATPAIAGLPPGMQQALRERGIDPQQAQRMAELIRDRRGQGGRGRGMTPEARAAMERAAAMGARGGAEGAAGQAIRRGGPSDAEDQN